jgi:small subunit ribosomal protein S11
MAQKRKDKAKKRVVVVEAVGQVHIKASFNNIIFPLPTTMARLFPGHLLVKWALKVQKRTLLMPLRWQLLIARKWLTN